MVDNEEVEEFHPLFDYGGAKKEEQRQRQTRRMTTDWLLEETETSKTQRGKETVVQRSRTARQLVDVEETESQEAIDTMKAEEDSRQKRENKRKEKESVVPPKKSRPDDEEVVIADISKPVSPLPEGREEDSNEEECELRWIRTSRKQQKMPATPRSTTFSFRHVVLTTTFLQMMLEFDDPKWQEEVHQRVTPQKKLKAGKIIHQSSLERIEMKKRFAAYITGIGFELLLEVDETPVPEYLAKKFFTSFRFTGSSNLEERSVSFRVFFQDQLMSLGGSRFGRI